MLRGIFLPCICLITFLHNPPFSKRHATTKKPTNPIHDHQKDFSLFKSSFEMSSLVVKRVRNIPSDRELYRRFWSDSKLRELWDIEDYEKPYHPSQLTRFRQRLGPEMLESLMETIIGWLRDAGAVKGEIVACDATFIKAYSKRDPKEDSKGYSDHKARVGRTGKGYHLNCKLHLAIGAYSELALAVMAAPANENEKKHSSKLLEKAIKASNGQTKVFCC